MENKVESPDYQMMDISEAGTITADNISTSSASPTTSNQAENEIAAEKNSEIEAIVETVTKNMNSIQLTTGGRQNQDVDSVENQNHLALDTSQQHHQPQKLTPVRHHPLMYDDNESEDSCNNAISNFPDVVLAHHQPPLRLAQPAAKSRATNDLVNSVNNNDAKSFRKPFYREPSPVSDHFSFLHSDSDPGAGS